jgi:hypothetical protein
MGILLVYDVTDQRSFDSRFLDSVNEGWAAVRVMLTTVLRHPHLVFKCRAARY